MSKTKQYSTLELLKAAKAYAKVFKEHKDASGELRRAKDVVSKLERRVKDLSKALVYRQIDLRNCSEEWSDNEEGVE